MSRLSNILIYRIGSLGDTLVAVPAIWTVRQNFPDARLTLLCEKHTDKQYVLAADLLENSRLMDDVITYDVVEGQNAAGRLFQMGMLLGRLRVRRFDALVYLAPGVRTPSQVRRDLGFFRLAGIRRVIGASDFTGATSDLRGDCEVEMREAERLLGRLARSGLSVAPLDQTRRDIDVNDRDLAAVERWRSQRTDLDCGRQWLAVGPGSKMPVKIWPAERYEEVVRRLIERYDVWPVIFGGAEDREVGRRLLDAWGRGYNAAGALALRPSAAGIGKCVMYLGNDTGTMHLAASCGVPCAAVFSSHNVRGRWYPIGSGHRIFRTTIECENCGLTQCAERSMECILRVDVEQVFQGCCEILDAVNVPVISQLGM